MKQPAAYRNDLKKPSISGTSFFALSRRVCTGMLPALGCVELAASATEVQISCNSKKAKTRKSSHPKRGRLVSRDRTRLRTLIP